MAAPGCHCRSASAMTRETCRVSAHGPETPSAMPWAQQGLRILKGPKPHRGLGVANTLQLDILGTQQDFSQQLLSGREVHFSAAANCSCPHVLLRCLKFCPRLCKCLDAANAARKMLAIAKQSECNVIESKVHACNLWLALRFV